MTLGSTRPLRAHRAAQAHRPRSPDLHADPHGSPTWQRGYKRRTALERINNRIDHSFGFEKHFIRGLAKMKARAGLAIVVMMSMALGHVRAGRTEQMRSLVRPIPNTA